MTKKLTNTLLGASALTLMSLSPALAETSACLITKTDTNPFFVR
jgi:fructose transport system substrate-binding protein